jgi:predicted amidophosphoribosyltransferase
VLDALVRRAFPARCPGCGAAGEPFCPTCAEGLRPARPGPVPDGLDALVVPFAYEGVMREVIARLKYRGSVHPVRWLAASVVRVRPARPRPDGGATPVSVTWAPTTPARRRARGFDHAQLLARHVGPQLALPVRRTLDRRPGPPQTGRSGADRRVGPVFRARRAEAGVVILVDDVVTTGATLGAAARELRRAGAGSVIGVAVARRG